MIKKSSVELFFLIRLLASILMESGNGEHFTGFFAGFGVHEEVLDVDLRAAAFGVPCLPL